MGAGLRKTTSPAEQIGRLLSPIIAASSMRSRSRAALACLRDCRSAEPSCLQICRQVSAIPSLCTWQQLRALIGPTKTAAAAINDFNRVDSPSVAAGKARIKRSFHSCYPPHLLLAAGLSSLLSNGRRSRSDFVQIATWQTLIYLIVLVLEHRTRTPIKSALVHQLPQASQHRAQTL